MLQAPLVTEGKVVGARTARRYAEVDRGSRERGDAGAQGPPRTSTGGRSGSSRHRTGGSATGATGNGGQGGRGEDGEEDWYDEVDRGSRKRGDAGAQTSFQIEESTYLSDNSMLTMR